MIPATTKFSISYIISPEIDQQKDISVNEPSTAFLEEEGYADEVLAEGEVESEPAFSLRHPSVAKKASLLSGTQWNSRKINTMMRSIKTAQLSKDARIDLRFLRKNAIPLTYQDLIELIPWQQVLNNMSKNTKNTESSTGLKNYFTALFYGDIENTQKIQKKCKRSLNLFLKNNLKQT